MKTDIDDILRRAEDPKAELKSLTENANEVTEPIVPPQKKSKAISQAPMHPTAYDFKSFRMLGEDKKGRLVIESRVNQKIYVRALKDFSHDQLVQIGGQEIIDKVYTGKYQPDSDRVHFRQLKPYLIAEAGRPENQLGELEYYGQGIHLLGNGNLLIVTGSQALTWDGRRMDDLASPLIEKKIIQRDPSRAWISLNDLKKRVLTMEPKVAYEIVENLQRCITQWGFQLKMDHSLVSGWFLAQIVQHLWSWRPNLWLTGASESGKSILLELFELLGGTLSLRREGQTLTEAGLRQAIGIDASLPYIDEIEKSEHRDQIINMLRSSGRGGVITKGTVSQEPVNFLLRHMVMLTSVESQIDRSAEKTRFINIETKKDKGKNPEFPNSSQIEDLRQGIFSYALWAAFRANELVEQIGRVQDHSNRFVRLYSVPFSMIAAADKNPTGCLDWMLEAALSEWSKNRGDSAVEDEEELFKSILSSSIKVPMDHTHDDGVDTSTVYLDRTISQLLAPDVYVPEVSETLQAYGIKGCRDGLFIEPKMIARKLLWNSTFRGLNPGIILARIEGVRRLQRTLAGSRPRGLLIPIEYCHKMGLKTEGWENLKT